MDKELVSHISSICQLLFKVEIKTVLSRPDVQFGDYSSNVAMQLAGKIQKNPKEIAESIVEELNKKNYTAEVAGPGFINIRLSDEILFTAAHNATILDKPLKDKTVVAEYSDPNPFKALHAGHLYTTLVGDSIANLLDMAGAKVVRVNFGGDVGLHTAKAMWGIIKNLDGENSSNLNRINPDERAEWINQCYTEGHSAYESGETDRQQIIEYNKQIYALHSNQEKNSDFASIYWTCRQWSYEGFDRLYESLHVKPFDKYYPESSVDDTGLKTVKEHLGDVYEESEGAIVFKGEKYGLFTQVFINSQGLTTYAGKDVGLILQKEQDFSPDISYIITDVSQQDHMRVVMKSIEQFWPELTKKTVHQTHGRIKLPGGQKMSSRSGKIVMASDVLESARESARGEDQDIIIGAVRYSFLRTKVGGDIVYDPVESVSHDGNSGPYLQYALVRARSIMAKIREPGSKPAIPESLDSYERTLARQLSMYPETFNLALNDYSPHHICSYLYELAQIFNRFYENSRVAGDPREELRASLVQSYEKVLSHGLQLLGMPTPEKM